MRLWLAAVLASPQLAAASVTFAIPAPGYPMPAVFSGTNCRASGLASAEGTNLKEVELWLKQGSLELKAAGWSHVQGPCVVPQRGFAVRFASTHFQHGQELWVYMKAKDGHDAWTTSAPVLVPVVNIAALYEHPDFALAGSTVDDAFSCLAVANHDVADYHRGGAWSRSDWLDSLEHCTALHANTHGGTDGHVLCGNGESAAASAMLGARQAAAAVGRPPVNVGLLDGCEVGGSQTPEHLLHPSNPPPSDRAIVGYSVTVNTYCAQAAGAAFWANLLEYETVGYARSKMRDAYYAKASELRSSGMSVDDISLQNITLAGGHRTRILGVFWPGPMPSGVAKKSPLRLEATFP